MGNTKQAKAALVLVGLMLGIAGIVITQTGCASIIGGTSQRVMLTSDPSGVRVITDTGETYVTPATINLKKGSSHTFSAEKEGYEKSVQTVGTSFNGWFLGNIFLGGLIGMIIDIADGAYLNPDRDSVYFHLSPKEEKQTNSKP